jgi:citrate lyase subunit beta/citryl-CoA lyase
MNGVDVVAARSMLFVPGHRPDRFAKAAASGADAVILDLEDAVGADQKVEAREHVRRWLDEGNPAVVRINAAGTPWHDEDVAMVATRAGAVLVPKAEDPAVLGALARQLSGGIVPLIETAAGILGAAAICGVPSVSRPAFGAVDLAVQLGVDHRSYEALRHARSTIVLAAAAAGCAPPMDSVTTALDDDEVLAADLREALTLGFTGKLCVHPRQVEVVHHAFAPSAEDVEWARGVLAAAVDGSVMVYRGQMIDRPVLVRAKAILARVVTT